MTGVVVGAVPRVAVVLVHDEGHPRGNASIDPDLRAVVADRYPHVRVVGVARLADVDRPADPGVRRQGGLVDGVRLGSCGAAARARERSARCTRQTEAHGCCYHCHYSGKTLADFHGFPISLRMSVWKVVKEPLMTGNCLL